MMNDIAMVFVFGEVVTTMEDNDHKLDKIILLYWS